MWRGELRALQFFNFGKKEKKAVVTKPKRETVIPAPSFTLQLGLLGIAGAKD